MRCSSLILLLAVAALATPSLHNDDPQAFQSSTSQQGSAGARSGEDGAGPQGWAGTPPSPEPPLEPSAPATIKEGEVWIPPLPMMDAVAPPSGW